jgi:hypothetical protein
MFAYQNVNASGNSSLSCRILLQNASRFQIALCAALGTQNRYALNYGHVYGWPSNAGGGDTFHKTFLLVDDPSDNGHVEFIDYDTCLPFNNSRIDSGPGTGFDRYQIGDEATGTSDNELQGFPAILCMTR